MLRNFKITLEYDGVDFKGWQIQKNGERTVQQEFEKACQLIFKHSVSVVASGRTDSGVHAKGQVVSFKVETRMAPKDIQRALNSRLPLDITILSVAEVDFDFHAQFSVKNKTYQYTILNQRLRSSFLKNHALHFPYDLNVTLMRKAAKVLVGKHDFKAFQAYDVLRKDKGTVRTIKKIVIKKQGNLIAINVTADGFLYKMVRNIVGTLIAIGAGQLPKDAMQAILQSRDRSKAHNTAAAHGLCLMTVKY